MKRKRLKIVATSLATLAVTSAAGVYAQWYVTRVRNEKLLRSEVEKLDAAEPGWRMPEQIAARNAALPPPEGNAGAQVLAALKLAPPSFVEWSKADTFRAKPVSNELMGGEEFAEAARVHGECAAALEVARRVAGMREGGFAITIAEPNPISTLLPHLQPMREGAGLLSLDAIVLAHARKPAEALRSCRAILSAARAGIGDEPTLVSQLVRIALTKIALSEVERTLAWTEPGPAELALTQATLAGERDVPRLLHGYRGERGMMFRLFENLDSGALTLNGLSDDRAPQGVLGDAAQWYFRQHVPANQAFHLRHVERLVASTALPDAERSAAVEELYAGIGRTSSASPGERVALLLMPAANKVNAAESLLRARLSCAVAALACERFRLAAGRWPGSLAEIPPDLLPTVAIDPYTGGPVGYAPTGEGAVVSCEGADPAGAPVRFRLWNPALRRAASPVADGVDAPPP